MIADQMANWLIGSILFSLGVLVLIFVCVLINNILHKYWKPVTIVFFRNESLYPNMRFSATEDNSIPKESDSRVVDKTKN